MKIITLINHIFVMEVSEEFTRTIVRYLDIKSIKTNITCRR